MSTSPSAQDLAQVQALLCSRQPGDMLLKWRSQGRLARILPEVDRLFGVPQRPEHHPEVDTGVHTALCLDVAASLDASPAARFAALTHDLGKALTPRDEWPAHIDHEHRGIAPVKALCARLGVPVHWTQVALLVCEHHLSAHRAFEARSKTVLRLLSDTGLETDSRLREDFLGACEADKRGRLGKSDKPYDQAIYLRLVALGLAALPVPVGLSVNSREGQALHRARLDVVRRAYEHVRGPRPEATQAANAIPASTPTAAEPESGTESAPSPAARRPRPRI